MTILSFPLLEKSAKKLQKIMAQEKPNSYMNELAIRLLKLIRSSKLLNYD